jgi:LCP family protein required for cell wall assembly
VSINPISMKITMSSIARDSYVPITCYNNGSSKINAAHSVSRDCLISTVQQLTGVSIDYYIDTNFQGVVDVVNALGGIVVNSPLEFVGQTASSVRGTKTVWVPAGDNVLLNGDQALAFARERYAFQTGDFARQEHQQQVIKAIIRTIMRTRDINTFLKVVQAFGDNVTTNFTVGPDDGLRQLLHAEGQPLL